MRKKSLQKKLAAQKALVKKLKKRLRNFESVDAPVGSSISPLAPDSFPDLPVIDGVRFSAVGAGVKYLGRADVMLAEITPGSSIAGVFTSSATRAAPVLDCQAKLRTAKQAETGAAILVNSGNANAFTGDNGMNSVTEICSAVSTALQVPESRVFTASTGVIGEPLPHDRIIEKIGKLAGTLDASAAEAAANAIMTTDTFAKGACKAVEIGGTMINITGFAKGSGMIAPDMATMLAYVFTDARVSQPVLQSMLSQAADTTFNAITVDSDTSTSDTLMVVATGQAEMPEIGSARTAIGKSFADALRTVLEDLAKQVVRDGEGATKFLTVKVTGAKTELDAKRAARAIADSPLVKTAIAGEDPNWGRVVMAVGKSGANADRDRLSIRFGDILVAENGWVSPNYSEGDAAAYMKAQELELAVDLGLGRWSATVWTCDLTKRYIEINADYRS
jgi:glutamate N-acetyltransferase/amino-acid N-acetyltransferase